MTERNYKRVAYGSKPYAFRFSGKTEDAYMKELDSLCIKMYESDTELSPSQALKEVIKQLIDTKLGRSLALVPSNSQIDVETLKNGILDELKEWLSNQLASPEKAAHLAHVSNMAANGQSIDDDVISNILEDFGR